MRQKYIHFSSKRTGMWNQMGFYGCKLLTMDIKEFKAGKRISLEIEAPKLRKKYYLYGFNDEGLVDAIVSSGLQEGDLISCFAELSYYKDGSGKYCEAYKLSPNQAYSEGMPEGEFLFQFMRIVREDKPKVEPISSGKLTKEDIMNKMLGIA